jgi:hypothetical protein
MKVTPLVDARRLILTALLLAVSPQARAASAGMDAFLLKPVNFSLLETAIFELQRSSW